MRTIFFFVTLFFSFHLKKMKIIIRRYFLSISLYIQDKLVWKSMVLFLSILYSHFFWIRCCTWMSDLAGNEHLGRAARAQYLCCLVLSLSVVYFSVKYFRLYHRRDDNESCSTDTQKKELPSRWASRRPSIFLFLLLSFFFDRWLEPSCDKL